MATKDIKIESLVDAIGHLNGCWTNPESDAYQLRSPLLLRSFARAGKHEVDVAGRRVFPSMLSGYKAACFDVLLKVSGNSRAGLKPETDCLENLLRVYGVTESLAHKKCLNFLRRALKKDDLGLKTPLSWFLQSDVQQLDEVK